MQKPCKMLPVGIYGAGRGGSWWEGWVIRLKRSLSHELNEARCVRWRETFEGIYWKSHLHAYTLEKLLFWSRNSFLYPLQHFLGPLAVNLPSVFIDREQNDSLYGLLLLGQILVDWLQICTGVPPSVCVPLFNRLHNPLREKEESTSPHLKSEMAP